jgi:hypothetical protein
MRASKTTPIEDYGSYKYFIQENHVKIIKWSHVKE